MVEIDRFIGMNTASDYTKKRYRDWYGRLLKQLNTKTLLDVDKNLILDAVIVLGKKSKIDYLSLVLSIFSKLNPDDDISLFGDTIKEWRNEKMDKQKDKNKEEISVMNYLQLNAILNNSMKTIPAEDYNAIYVLVLFLIVKYNTRNMDLIIRYIKKKDLDDKGNYLYFDGPNLMYVRNDYKTADKYGEKIIKITNPFIKRIIKKNSFIKLNELVINTQKGIPFNNITINRFIGNIIPKLTGLDIKLNQQIIYKIIRNHFEDKNSYSKLDKMTNNRGHSHSVAAAFYS